MNVEVKINPAKVIRNIRQLGPKFHRALTAGMVNAVEQVYDPLMEITPLKEGWTRGSFAAFDGDRRIFVSRWGPHAGEKAATDHGLPLDRDKRTLVLTFNTDYSETIHENPYGWTFRTPGTQAKFLETVFYAYADQIVQIIGRSAQEGLTGLAVLPRD